MLVIRGAYIRGGLYSGGAYIQGGLYSGFYSISLFMEYVSILMPAFK